MGQLWQHNVVWRQEVRAEKSTLNAEAVIIKLWWFWGKCVEQKELKEKKKDVLFLVACPILFSCSTLYLTETAHSPISTCDGSTGNRWLFHNKGMSSHRLSLLFSWFPIATSKKKCLDIKFHGSNETSHVCCSHVSIKEHWIKAVPRCLVT